MAIIKLQPYTIDETKNFTFNNVTATGDVFASNANLGNIVTANFFTGALTTNAQPNITSVGTLSNLAVTGNITSGNANLGNLVVANFFSGDGSLLTGINANAANANFANFAGTVTTNEQPNITSVGTLTTLTVAGNTTAYHIFPAALDTYDLGSSSVPWRVAYTSIVEAITVNANTGNFSSSLAVTGNITGGNANLGNLVVANFFSGDGSLLTNIIAGSGSFIENGNSNVVVQANANVNISANGVANVLVVTGSGANITGDLTSSNAALGNTATANYFTGTLTTAAQPNITSVGTLTSLGVTGNITSGNANLGNLVVANFFSGNGSLLTGITASDANFANFAGTVTTNAQPNITSVGTLTSLGVSGNITAANITANTGVFTGNGSGLTAIAGANVTGTVANATFATTSGTAGTVTTNAQPNITSTGTLSNLTVNGNLVVGGGSGGNISNANVISANTFIGNGSQLTGVIAVTAGTVTTNAQPNITSVGTLTSLGVSGNITAANITANTGVFTGNGSGLSSLTFGNISNFATANLTVDELYSQGITRLDVTANGTSGYIFDQYGASNNPPLYVSSGQTLVFLLSVTGHPFLIQDSSSANYSTGLIHVTSNGTVTTSASAQGQIAGTLYWKVPYGITGNYKYQCSVHGGMNGNIVIADANVSNHAVSTAATVTTNAQPNITSLGTLTALTVGPNSSIVLSGSSGFVKANSIQGIDGTAAIYTYYGNVSGSVGIYSNLTVGTSGSGNLIANSGKVIFGNVGDITITGGTANYVLSTDGTGNLDWVAQSGGGGSANIQILDEGIILTNSVSSINFTGSGVTASNIGNAVTVDISTGGGGGSSISNGTSSVSIATANGNITMSVGGTSNVFVTSNTGISVSGISNLGNVGNVKITGGTANYVLSTDGTGNLDWVAQSGGGGAVANAITLDSFTGNGVQTNFTLSTTPQSENYTLVNIDGVSQLKTDYSLSGNTLILSGPPAAGASIEVTTITVSVSSGNSISNGTSNVSIDTANGNITMSVGGTSNVFVTSNTGVTVSGISDLGNVGNVKITGGTANYVLSTDGTGNLDWVAQSGGGGSGGNFVTRTYTGNGVQNTFAVTSGVTDNSILVMENGIVQVPVTDYSVSGANLIFTSPPANSMAIQVRELSSVSSGGSGNIQILDEGSILTNSVSSIDFVGSGVTASNTGNAVTVTVSGGITAQDLLSPFLLMGA